MPALVQARLPSWPGLSWTSPAMTEPAVFLDQTSHRGRVNGRGYWSRLGAAQIRRQRRRYEPHLNRLRTPAEAEATQALPDLRAPQDGRPAVYPAPTSVDRER